MHSPSERSISFRAIVRILISFTAAHSLGPRACTTVCISAEKIKRYDQLGKVNKNYGKFLIFLIKWMRPGWEGGENIHQEPVREMQALVDAKTDKKNCYTDKGSGHSNKAR